MQNLKFLRDAPIDAYKKQKIGNFVTGQDTINVPTGAVFVKGVEVFDSTSASTGNNRWLEKKDESYLQEYIPSTEGDPQLRLVYLNITPCLVEQLARSDTDSGRLFVAPAPDQNYILLKFITRLYLMVYQAQIQRLILVNIFSGLLYACLVEAYGFLKGPMDMLTLYEK